MCHCRFCSEPYRSYRRTSRSRKSLQAVVFLDLRGCFARMQATLMRQRPKPVELLKASSRSSLDLEFERKLRRQTYVPLPRAGTRSPAFKTKMALAAAKGDRTTAQLAEHFDVHPMTAWKRGLRAGLLACAARRARYGRARGRFNYAPRSGADTGERSSRRSAHHGVIAEDKWRRPSLRSVDCQTGGRFEDQRRRPFIISGGALLGGPSQTGVDRLVSKGELQERGKPENLYDIRYDCHLIFWEGTTDLDSGLIR